MDPCGTPNNVSEQELWLSPILFIIFCLISSHELAVMQVAFSLSQQHGRDNQMRCLLIKLQMIYPYQQNSSIDSEDNAVYYLKGIKFRGYLNLRLEKRHFAGI